MSTLRSAFTPKAGEIITQSSFSGSEVRMASSYKNMVVKVIRAVGMGKFQDKPVAMATQGKPGKQCRQRPCPEFDDIDPAKDQIRMDEETQRLVILIQPMFKSDNDLPDGKNTMPWMVRDILCGALYVRDETQLWGRLYNELEALGWSAQDHPDVDVLGD